MLDFCLFLKVVTRKCRPVSAKQSLEVTDVHLEYLQIFGDDCIWLIAAVFAHIGTSGDQLLNKYEIKQTLHSRQALKNTVAQS